MIRSYNGSGEFGNRRGVPLDRPFHSEPMEDDLIGRVDTARRSPLHIVSRTCTGESVARPQVFLAVMQMESSLFRELVELLLQQLPQQIGIRISDRLATDDEGRRAANAQRSAAVMIIAHRGHVRAGFVAAAERVAI